jgi:tetratricopeptide (TPR) repeat protein
MTIIEQLKTLYLHKNFDQALVIINKEINRIKTLPISLIKQELNQLRTAEDIQVLIRIADHFLMFQYSSFLVRYAYRRFPNLLTISWYCEELLENGKLLEADDIISAVTRDVKEISIDDASEDHEGMERIHFCKIRCLLEMKHFKEAEKQLENLQGSSRKHLDKIGYTYMELGKREKAQQILSAGIEDPERGPFCYLLLSNLKASNGELIDSLKLMEEAEQRFSNYPSFLLEKIRRYRDLSLSNEMLDAIRNLNLMIPEHAYHSYFSHLKTVAFYQLNDFENLEAIVKEERIEHLQFKLKEEKGEYSRLPIKPIIQKSNYCVPASLEMILTYYGVQKTQDEIAAEIFNDTGSKLSTTIDFLERNGFACRYFIGNKEQYQTLLRNNIPILLSVDFEHSSHVQVLKGYDSRYDLYHIQDPNMLETIYVTRENLEKANAATSYLSIVFVPIGRVEDISFLSCEEDKYFRKLHDFGEKMECDEVRYKEAFYQFLQENGHVPYSQIYVIKHFSFEEDSDYINQCADKVLEMFPDNDFMNLHVAQTYMRLQQMEKAKELLGRVNNKTFSPLFHFIKGRIALYFDQMQTAIKYFRTSLQLDPDQYFTWSYLALSYLYSNNVPKAEYYSIISLELAPDDRFVRMNHAAVLIEKNEFIEARKVYNQLIQEDPQDGHTWYERARLDQKLGSFRKAAKGYQFAIKLETNVHYAYLATADLYEFEFDQPLRAEKILLSGIEAASHSQLYVRLGDYYREQNQITKASYYYEQCIEQYPEERLAYIGMAEVYARSEGKQRAVEFIKEQVNRFNNDSEFLINSGRVMAELVEKEDAQLLEESLQFVEEGISQIHSNLAEALELYVRLVENTAFENRALAFFNERSIANPDIIEYKCFSGLLLEQKHHFAAALECYHAALLKRADSFPYFRMGEVYMKIGKFLMASEAYGHCISLEPNNKQAYLRLAEIASMVEGHEKVAKHLLALLEIEPLSVDIEYLSSILNEVENECLLKKLQTLGGYVPEVWRLDALAYVYGALGDTENEAKTLSAVLLKRANSFELLHHQAKLFIKLKKWKKVQSILELLLNKNAQDESVYLTLIHYTAAVNKWSKLPKFLLSLNGPEAEKGNRLLLTAEAGQQFIAEMNWGDEEQGNALGRLVRKMRNRTKQITVFAAIIELYEMAIKLDKENLYPISRYAEFYGKFDLIEDAIKILQKALKSKYDSQLAYQLGMLYLQVEDFHSALALFERQLSIQPNDSHLRYMAASILLELGHTGEAEHKLVRIVEEDPYEANVHYKLGWLLNQQGRYRGAKEILEHGVLYHPFDENVKIQLSLALSYMDEYEEALRVINEVVLSEEGNLEARYNKACYLALLNRSSEAKSELDCVFEHDETGYYYELAQKDDDLINLVMLQG